MLTETTSAPRSAGDLTVVDERAVLITVTLATMLAPLNSTMIAVALPRITADFAAGATSAGWLVTAYLIIMATFQPIAGKLGDQFGRRPLLLGGLAGFGLASAGAALAPNLLVLVALRALQALAGALALPNGVALLRELIPAERRGVRSGTVGAAVALAAAAGPPLGGLLVTAGGWRAIFLVNLLLVVPALLIGWRAIPSAHSRASQRHFDLAGALMLAGLLVATALLLMLGRAETSALPSAVALAGGLALFLRRELAYPDPLIPPRLFRRRAFAAANGAIGLSNLAMYVALLALPVWLARLPGWSSARSGLALAALSATSVLFAPIGGRLTDRYGRRWPTVAGLGLLALGLSPLALFASDRSAGQLGALLGGLALAGIGLGLASAGLQTSAVEAADAREAGVASGVFSTSRYLGSIVGSSVLAGLLATGRLELAFPMVVLAASAAAIVGLALRDWPARDTI
jgi:EmrB/QacA subfamily drug resistance transporter